MFNKIFKEPNRILKIVTVALVAVAVLSCLIWILVANSNLSAIADEVSFHDDVYNGLVQNRILTVAAVVFTLLGITLLVCWLRITLQKPSKIFKFLIAICSLIALCVLWGWCVIQTSAIVDSSNSMVELICGALENDLSPAEETEFINAVVEIRNNETSVIIKNVIQVAALSAVVFLAALLLYGLVDGCSRIVCSLERIADNSGKTKSQEQNTEIQKNTDCQTSVPTGSQ